MSMVLEKQRASKNEKQKSRFVTWISRKSVKHKIWMGCVYLIICLIAVIFLVPLAWMISSSLKEEADIFKLPPEWIPKPFMFSNYPSVWQKINIPLLTKNTATITLLSMFGLLLSSSLVAYGFARIRFKGSNILFLILLATMMVPSQVTLIPRYIIFKNLHWLNTFKPLIVPNFFGSAFYIFLMRQFFMTIPFELDDAARIDGYGHLGIYSKIILPLSKPVLATAAIFTFMGEWTAFFGPLIYLHSAAKRTLVLGLSTFRGTYYTSSWHLIMAGSVLIAVPCMLMFFFAQKYFVQGITLTGIKG
jgi:ABC-type glycerol-3-phosphate transport system permease component